MVGPYKTATMVKAGYSSSNKKVAAVSGKGYLTAKKTETFGKEAMKIFLGQR